MKFVKSEDGYVAHMSKDEADLLTRMMNSAKQRESEKAAILGELSKDPKARSIFEQVFGKGRRFPL